MIRYRLIMCRAIVASVSVLVGVSSLGCQSGGAAERYGKTFFLDGAGNWGDGGAQVADGLRAGGYQGDVEEYVWTTSFNPLVDQLNIVAAKMRARAFAARITQYHNRYPENAINVVALSAGTGVATWAVEQLGEGVLINHLVLLGSSISFDYDMSAALRHMRGNILVYWSQHDCVLEKVRTIGTIDGRRGVDSIGLVGLSTPEGLEQRIINTPWARKWLRWGWTGAHSDCTNSAFVRHEISRHLVEQAPATELLAAR